MERLKPSPFSDDGILGLPYSAIEAYFKECKENGSWNKVSALLKHAWDLNYFRATDKSGRSAKYYAPSLGDSIGIHLMEAYLQEGRPGDADDIFKAVIEAGGKFKDISKIAELAKSKGYERIAAEWVAATAPKPPNPS
jgi:hypothetical protein